MSEPSLFLLLGEPFLCEEKRKEILSSLQKKFGPELAVGLRRAGGFEMETLVAEARTLPFLAPAQLFCVRGADRLLKKELEALALYFESPHPQSFFIFEAQSLERNHPLLEWGRKQGQVFLLESERSKLVAHLIQQKLKQAEKKITREAAGLLETRLENSLEFLDSFLDRLILSAGEKPEITREAVEALEDELSRFEGYDLLQALAAKKVSKALEVLNQLLEWSGEDLPSLVGLLHWQLRRFWEAKRMLSGGSSEGEASARLRISPRAAPYFFRELARFSLEELERMLDGLFELDRELKTGRAAGRYEMEAWLVRSQSF